MAICHSSTDLSSIAEKSKMKKERKTVQEKLRKSTVKALHIISK